MKLKAILTTIAVFSLGLVLSVHTSANSKQDFFNHYQNDPKHVTGTDMVATISFGFWTTECTLSTSDNSFEDKTSGAGPDGYFACSRCNYLKFKEALHGTYNVVMQRIAGSHSPNWKLAKCVFDDLKDDAIHVQQITFTSDVTQLWYRIDYGGWVSGSETVGIYLQRI